MSDLVREIERLAFDAWSAAEVEPLGGWRLRFNAGVTNRANSVWTAGPPDDLELADKVARVEDFYAARGLPPLLQVCAVSSPGELDAALAARGYRLFSPVQVQTAELSELPADAPGPGVETSCGESLDETWFQISGHRGRFSGDEIPVYRALLQRAVGTPVFALARLEGEPAGVGFGVVRGDWLGVFSMLTLPECRRAGVGRAVLQALVGFSRTHGARRAYLQVEQDNPAALGLYAGAGFATRYRYHYRKRET